MSGNEWSSPAQDAASQSFPVQSALVAEAQIKAYIKRIERVKEAVRDLNADLSEIYKEAKGNGFDVPTIKRVVAARQKDPAERDAQDVMFDIYWAAVEGAPRVHVHAHTREGGAS